MKRFKAKESVTWAEIDMSALAYNFGQVKKAVGDREIIPVIKANAYGHGIAEFASYLTGKLKVKMLGVARVNEAVLLREAGIKNASIIILGGFFKGEIDTIIGYKLEPSVFAVDEARALNAAAVKSKTKVNAHLKVNTGMNRLGIRPADAYSFFGSLRGMPGLVLKSVYTHFANADLENTGDYSTKRQAADFRGIQELAGKGVLIHAANSAAIAKYPYSYYDAVRPGIMLYGSYADRALKRYINVKPVMTLKSRVIHTAWLDEGEAVSYGGLYRSRKKERITVIGIGYGDGFKRELSSKWYVKISGKEAPVLGRVCMDMIIVRAPVEVKIGDEALVFGRDKKGSIDVEDMAAAANTISYEIFTGITERVVRVYK
jgi:alanine racemase